LIRSLTKGRLVTLDQLLQCLARGHRMPVMVGSGAGAKSRLKVRSQRWFQQLSRIPVGEGIRQELLPLRSVEALADSPEKSFEQPLGI
jgi:hypothetical protein